MPRLPAVLLVLAMLVALLALPQTAEAPDPIWGPIQEVSADRRIENQRYPAVAVGTRIHAVWSDMRDRDYDLYHRSSDGSAWGAVTELSSDRRDEYQWYGDIAVEGAVAHAVWQDQAGGDWDIMYRRFDGSAWGPIAEVSVDVGSEAQNLPKVAAAGGRVVVAWQDGRDGDWDIYVRIWDGAWGAAQQVSTDVGTEAQQAPALAMDGSVVHVAWQDRGSGTWDVRYRRFDGSAWGAIQTVAGGAGDQTEPEIAALGGRVHLVWQDTAGGDRDIWYREWTGASWAAPAEVSQDAGAEFQRLPVVAAETSRVHVGWIDYRDGDGDYVYRYREGGVWSARLPVSVDVGTEAQWEPEIAAEPNRVHFIWEDPRGGDLDIFYRTATFPASSDAQPPDVRDARIDGQPARTYGLSVLPATVTLTATVDDRSTGNSPIGGANYTTPTPTSFPGLPMAAADGAFDNPLEDVRATPAPPRTKGTFAYCVRGWDNVGNANPVPSCASLTVLDDVPPEIRSVRVNGQATLTVPIGTPNVLLTATIDDGARGGSRVLGGNYTVGVRAWPGSPLNPTDGAWDGPTEDGRTTVATSSWPAGTYTLCAYGSDEVPNHNTAGACATLVVSADAEPPRVSDVRIAGQSDAVYALSALPASLVLTALVDDTATGGSAIAGANYTIGLPGWPGHPMAAADGALDGPLEEVTATFVPTPRAGRWTIYAFARDASGNENTTAEASATLTILDDLPPEVRSVRLDGQATLARPVGTPSVLLTATIDDTVTGGSPIAAANYTLGPGGWPGAPLEPSDGAWDAPAEDGRTALDVSVWAAGTYAICAYGSDGAGNGNRSGACASLVLTAAAPGNRPPTVSEVTAAPDPARPGTAVVIRATVEDDRGVAGVWAQLLGPGGEVANLTMTLRDGRWEVPWIASGAGAHTVRVWAVDSDGLWATGDGFLSVVPEEAPPSAWNVKPAVAVAFALAILLLAWRHPARRRFAVPLALAELGTGAASLAVPALQIPPVLGAGTAIDLFLLLLGILVPPWLVRRAEASRGEKR